MRQLKLFTEYHHGGLFHSIVRLFEKRLGIKVFAPCGVDWQARGLWNYSTNEAVIRQFLSIDYCQKKEDGYYYYYDSAELLNQRRITFDQFKKEKFDILLCALSEDEEVFRKLKREYQKDAILIRLVGNSFERLDALDFDLILDTTSQYEGLDDEKIIQISQEFDTSVFNFEEPKYNNRIYSFLNEFKTAATVKIYYALKSAMSDFEFRMFGSNGDDGMITPYPKLAEKIKESTFVIHLKPQGDGFGHIIHNALACGRPVITYKRFYEGRRASKLLIDEESAIFLDDLGIDEMVKKIKRLAYTNEYLRMAKKTALIFKQKVNFRLDEIKVRSYLKRYFDL